MISYDHISNKSLMLMPKVCPIPTLKKHVKVEQPVPPALLRWRRLIKTQRLPWTGLLRAQDRGVNWRNIVIKCDKMM